MMTRPTGGCCSITDARVEPQTARRTEPSAGSVGGPTFRPSVDIQETPEKFTIIADLPGVKPDGIDLVIEQGVLTLKAAVQPRVRSGARTLISEYGVGDFERTFKLGEGVASDLIAAEFSNGVLTLTLPKSPAAKARKIEVRGN